MSSARAKEAADARAARLAAVAAAKREQDEARQHNFDSHVWGSLRGVGRCVGCHISRKHEEAARGAPCRSDWGKVMLVGSRARGHRIFVALVERLGEQPSPLLICLACGCWAESGISRGLTTSCTSRPTRNAEAAIARVRRGLCPKAGKAARGGIVSELIPAHS